ncbi:hypothetical protein POX_a00703 [Penicillium oxalicum]|uniref:DUF7907 domain-containing protein n=1 Tax=Penicillium oxalicum (strain 114-2 / CGMCC 5302) TaxID=933388 RepID=S7ZUG0_PENO1|nr:hypothetical protein POX_a00703 [Penicillium oxalicum]EPS34325.1 hypothetical protein PDE_09289 [Penicillium oxalicum 114-2]KAI2794113.1 hypothetical protein POX_a00703 [Penicillium oxalicum]
MQVLATLALMATAVMANPVATAPKEFHLKTAGASNAKHNDLFVYGYHTGAGLNDAVLSEDSSIASAFYLNGTTALADFKTEFPWGVIAVGDTNYASWEPVEINVGSGMEGFSIDNGNFVFSEDYGFGGWLVCDWYHNAPQLFYLNRYYKPTIPSSCSTVQLKAISL